jgi:hypothetical protein
LCDVVLLNTVKQAEVVVFHLAQLEEVFATFTK